jgi:WD40 repeat protein/DNA-binding SARP family transcriptional activator
MLQVRLLAQFDVRVDNKRVVIPSRAAQSLLAYLTLNPSTSHRREKLAGLIWPEMPEDSARHNLRHELWRLRKIISLQQSDASEYILADEIAIAFNADAPHWLDVAQLERAQPDLSAGELIAQVALYRGELLPGFYDDWVMLERERVQVVFEGKMQQLLERLIAEQQWRGVLEWAERWIALGDTPEPAYRALMVAHGALGETSQVALAYERCVEALRNELGVEPSAETRILYEKLARGEETSRAIVAPLPSILVQPSGTVTFLFSDIEGSTKLLERLGDEYAILLSDQIDLLRGAAEKFNGHEVDTQGDAFFFAFFRAADAVGFAAEAQRQLTSHSWPQGATLRVRMGLHTGEPMLARTGYVGMDVHRAARIGAAGHGGQVLMSRTTRDLVENDLPPNTHLTDLGEHKLKDLRYPVHIVQLTLEDLPSEFPPLKVVNTGSEPPAPGDPPFKGLQYFDESDAALFFGREQLVSKLVGNLNPSPFAALRDGAGNFLAVVVGASGSGKSSIVRAGVIPALRRGESLADGRLPPAGSAFWRIFVLTPTAHPLEALATALTHDSESVTATATLMDDLAKDPRSLHLYLGRELAGSRWQIADSADAEHRSQSAIRHTMLVVDQFEELFTLCRDDIEREAFIDNLLTTLAPYPALTRGEGSAEGGLVTLIITIRADFYAHLAQYPELRDAVAQHQEYIGPMTAEELRRAIEEPAKRGGWELQPGLVDLMLRDVGDEPGALPLLSHALLETWKRRSGHLMTLSGYADAGGVRGAIAHTAETTYQQLSSEQQAIARGIFLRLTELGEATEDTRRRVSFAELIPQGKEGMATRAVLTQLADARLITTSENFAEVAHEAVIREWPRLREWLNQDRDGLRLHRRLTEAAQEWELLERDPGALYRGAQLAQVTEFAQGNPNAFNEQERAFLDASMENQKREEREREEARQRELLAKEQLLEAEQVRVAQERAANRRLRRRALFLASAFVLAIVLALIALFFGEQARQSAVTAQVNQRTAEQERRSAFSRELAASAINNIDVDPERSVLLALQAVRTTYEADQTVTKEAAEALHRAVPAARAPLTLRGHTDFALHAVFSPDGTRVVTNSSDGSFKLWDAVTGSELLTGPTLQTDTPFIPKTLFNRDGTRLINVNRDAGDTVVVETWDIASGKKLSAVPLAISGSTLTLNSLSPDGTRIAFGSIFSGNDATVWDLTTGELLLTLKGHTREVLDVEFSPDGTRIATASADGTAKIWDARTGNLLFTLSGNDQGIWGLAYSPDGTRIVTASEDSTVKVWDASTGREVFTFSGHTNFVTAVAFSPDGKRAASVGYDQKIFVWDAQTGKVLFNLIGHGDSIADVAFSPDGKRLVTVGYDHTAKVWDLKPTQELRTLDTGLRLWGFGVSSNGKRLATAHPGVAVNIWDTATNKLLFTVPGMKSGSQALNDIAISPDGSRVVRANDDMTGQVWDLAAGTPLLELIGHQVSLVRVAYSPDGRRIATTSDFTASHGGTAKIWDAVTGKEIFSLPEPENIGVYAVAFSPDGNLIATGTAKTVTLWDAHTGKLNYTLNAHKNVVFALAFSPDSKRLVTGGREGDAKVWDVATREQLFLLSGHTSTVFAATYSHDGTRIATGSYDATTKLWDAATGKELLTLYGHTNGVVGVAFTPDDTGLITSSEDGTVRYYVLRIEDLVALAKTRVTRSLTSAECQKFLRVEQCPNTP